MNWRTAGRLALATLVVLGVAHFFARDAVRLLLPILSPALGFAADDFKIVRFELFEERQNTSIGALAVLERSLFLGGRAIVPDGTQVMVVSTTVGTVLQPALVALVLLLAWPARWSEMAWRLAIATPLLALSCCWSTHRCRWRLGCGMRKSASTSLVAPLRSSGGTSSSTAAGGWLSG